MEVPYQAKIDPLEDIVVKARITFNSLVAFAKQAEKERDDIMYTKAHIAFLRDRVETREARVTELEEALVEIALAEGPFDRDALTHAGNVIEAMADIARDALASPDPKEGPK